MPTRDVEPFDSKQWTELQKNMKRGPTQKQIEKMKEARKRATTIRRENFDGTGTVDNFDAPIEISYIDIEFHSSRKTIDQINSTLIEHDYGGECEIDYKNITLTGKVRMRLKMGNLGVITRVLRYLGI